MITVRTTATTNNSQHMLTLKQVNIICARILKEREEKIREEYDRILANKLNGKYETKNFETKSIFRLFRAIRRFRSIYSRSTYTKIFRITIFL